MFTGPQGVFRQHNQPTPPAVPPLIFAGGAGGGSFTARHSVQNDDYLLHQQQQSAHFFGGATCRAAPLSVAAPQNNVLHEYPRYPPYNPGFNSIPPSVATLPSRSIGHLLQQASGSISTRVSRSSNLHNSISSSGQPPGLTSPRPWRPVGSFIVYRSQPSSPTWATMGNNTSSTPASTHSQPQLQQHPISPPSNMFHCPRPPAFFARRQPQAATQGSSSFGGVATQQQQQAYQSTTGLYRSVATPQTAAFAEVGTTVDVAASSRAFFSVNTPRSPNGRFIGLDDRRINIVEPSGGGSITSGVTALPSLPAGLQRQDQQTNRRSQQQLPHMSSTNASSAGAAAGGPLDDSNLVLESEATTTTLLPSTQPPAQQQAPAPQPVTIPINSYDSCGNTPAALPPLQSDDIITPPAVSATVIPGVSTALVRKTATAAARRAAAHHQQQPQQSSKGLFKLPTQFSLPTASTAHHVRFSWIVARALVKLLLQPAESFRLSGHPWSSWCMIKVPTLGASPTSCRVQEMYKVEVPPASPGGRVRRVFAKVVPIDVWRRQWECQNKWNGEYVTDGENFVMEAAALAFLDQYGPDLAPKLLGVLELSGPIDQQSSSTAAAKQQLAAISPPSTASTTDTSGRGVQGGGAVTHIAILSELYGEDLLDFLERRDKQGAPLTVEEKRVLQLDCLMLMKRLHTIGLSHLDFTPENVLIGDDGLRICDFAKATPLTSLRLRHTKVDGGGGRQFPFESCEPTVGKGAYMPPECWRVYWHLEETRTQYPLEELWTLCDPVDRAPFYFSVEAADVYMVGVLMFWLWSEGGIWKCSDVDQDTKYAQLVKSGLSFDLFRECRSWPSSLKTLLRSALSWRPEERASLGELLDHSWFYGCKTTSTRTRWPKMASSEQHQHRGYTKLDDYPATTAARQQHHHHNSRRGYDNGGGGSSPTTGGIDSNRQSKHGGGRKATAAYAIPASAPPSSISVA